MSRTKLGLDLKEECEHGAGMGKPPICKHCGILLLEKETKDQEPKQENKCVHEWVKTEENKFNLIFKCRKCGAYEQEEKWTQEPKQNRIYCQNGHELFGKQVQCEVCGGNIMQEPNLWQKRRNEALGKFGIK